MPVSNRNYRIASPGARADQIAVRAIRPDMLMRDRSGGRPRTATASRTCHLPARSAGLPALEPELAEACGLQRRLVDAWKCLGLRLDIKLWRRAGSELRTQARLFGDRSAVALIRRRYTGLGRAYIAVPARATEMACRPAKHFPGTVGRRPTRISRCRG